jgi:hypothetical protein
MIYTYFPSYDEITFNFGSFSLDFSKNLAFGYNVCLDRLLYEPKMTQNRCFRANTSYGSSSIWDLTLRQSSDTRFCRGSIDIS